MVTRRTAIGSLAALVLLAGAARPARATQAILIGGGPAGSVRTVAARRICDIVNEHAGDSYRCLARPISGSAFTIRAVDLALLEFGLARSDRSHAAASGTGAWEGAPVARLRSAFGLHRETVLLVTRADTGIARVADLVGRTVNIGSPGSGPRGNALDVLRLHGIDRMQDIETRSLKPEDASRALVEGVVDAFFCTVGNPAAAVAAAAEAVPIAIVPIESEAIRSFVAERPYYVMAEVPPGTYEGVATAVPTYAATATAVTGADVAGDLVHDVVRAVFENLDALRRAHPALGSLDPAAMLQGLAAPLHEGAARYYREHGWL